MKKRSMAGSVTVTLRRAQCKVGDGVLDVGFHEGDMLVGGGMEHDVRFEAGEDVVQPGLVADVGDDKFDARPAARPPASVNYRAQIDSPAFFAGRIETKAAGWREGWG